VLRFLLVIKSRGFPINYTTGFTVGTGTVFSVRCEPHHYLQLELLLLQDLTKNGPTISLQQWLDNYGPRASLYPARQRCNNLRHQQYISYKVTGNEGQNYVYIIFEVS